MGVLNRSLELLYDSVSFSRLSLLLINKGAFFGHSVSVVSEASEEDWQKDRGSRGDDFTTNADHEPGTWWTC